MMNESKRQQANAVMTLRLPASYDQRSFLVSNALLVAQMTQRVVVIRSTVTGEPGVLFLTASHGPRLETTTEHRRPWMARVAVQLGLKVEDLTLLGHVAGQQELFDA